MTSKRQANNNFIIIVGTTLLLLLVLIIIKSVLNLTNNIRTFRQQDFTHQTNNQDTSTVSLPSRQEQPSQSEEIVKDIDGNIYHTVKIGNQVWFRENLKVTRYRNGDLIPKIINGEEWGNQTSGAFFPAVSLSQALCASQRTLRQHG